MQDDLRENLLAFSSAWPLQAPVPLTAPNPHPRQRVLVRPTIRMSIACWGLVAPNRLPPYYWAKMVLASVVPWPVDVLQVEHGKEAWRLFWRCPPLHLRRHPHHRHPLPPLIPPLPLPQLLLLPLPPLPPPPPPPRPHRQLPQLQRQQQLPQRQRQQLLPSFQEHW